MLKRPSDVHYFGFKTLVLYGNISVEVASEDREPKRFFLAKFSQISPRITFQVTKKVISSPSSAKLVLVLLFEDPKRFFPPKV